MSTYFSWARLDRPAQTAPIRPQFGDESPAIAPLVLPLQTSDERFAREAVRTSTNGGTSHFARRPAPDKGVDFEGIKPYLRDGGWGRESYQAMVATCGMVYAEGKRRAGVLKKRGINNWFDVTDDPSFRPLVLISDEYTGLMTEERVPKALSKDRPMQVEAKETNGYRDMMAAFILKIALEMRFVGVHVFVSTQLGSTRTGVSTALKAACGNRFLMGPNASDNQRSNAFSAPMPSPSCPTTSSPPPECPRASACPRPRGSPHRVRSARRWRSLEWAAGPGGRLGPGLFRGRY